MIKILGAIDIIIAALFVLSAYGFVTGIAAFAAIYLAIKGLLFLLMGFNSASLIDVAAAASMLLSLPAAFVVIVALLLAQKGIFSLF